MEKLKFRLVFKRKINMYQLQYTDNMVIGLVSPLTTHSPKQVNQKTILPIQVLD